MKDDKKILLIIGKYYKAFPASKKIDADAVPVYAELLADIPADKIEIAMRNIAMTSKYFPTVAEIRESVAAIPPTAAEIAAKAAERDAIKKKRDQEQSEYLKRVWGCKR